MLHLKSWIKKTSRFVALSGLLLVSVTGTAADVPKFAEVKARAFPSEAILYDRHHEVIHEQRINSRFRQLPWISLDAISPIFKKAVILSEDHRFGDHSGVDWIAVLSSTAGNVLSRFQNNKIRGASTITMQLVALLDQDLSPPKSRRRKGIFQKWRQIQAAEELEKTWTKKEILEAYFNLVPFRSELRGLPAASYGLFGKAPDGLDFKEAVLLAALIPSPQASAEVVEKRACVLGKKIDAQFDCGWLKNIVSNTGLKNIFIQPKVAIAPHAARRVLKAPTGVSTLDAKTQRFVLSTLQHQIQGLKDRNVNDGAALVIDNRSGEVLAYVGNVGEFSSAYYVDGVTARRQAGSTLKPFLYALAFENRYLTPASWVDDTPADFPVLGGVYRPRNYDHEFHGENITVRTALASSLNVPAVRTLNLVGVDPFVRKLKELGFEGLQNSEFYGPSLALGSADVTLWDLTNAYRVLANHGKWSELILDRTEGRKKGDRTLFSRETAFLISSILSDRESRSLTFGLENALSQTFWTAVKTGTSKDMRDNWCVGYSAHYTVGVWTGNFSGQPMWNVSGVLGAAPAWAEIMRFLHQKLPSPSLEQQGVPKGVIAVQSGAKKEWFIQGTEPSGTEPMAERLANPAQIKITYPLDGTFVALDPDIPRELQKIVFEHSPTAQKLKWRVNGFDHPQASDPLIWSLGEPGRVKISLLDGQEKILDEVQFTVR